MIDAAFPRARLMPVQRNVREYKGKKWSETGHDLDRIFELDGLSYGVEVKNQLQYIEAEEFQAKLAMCRALELKPLFVARMLPKSYVNDIFEQGGYARILKYQLYPHGSEGLARRVRDELGLPVDSPPAIYDGTLQRFTNWHEKTRNVPANSREIHGANIRKA